MDAREQLRRYLEQRREMGETELVLDTLGVDEALRLLGAAGGAAGGGSSSTRTAAPSVSSPSPEARRSVPDVSAPSASPESIGDGGDWRDALRAAGASPTELSKKKVSEPGNLKAADPPDAPHVVSSPPPAAAPIAGAPPGASTAASPLSDIPAGLSVGTAGGELLGSMASLESLEAIAEHVAACTRCPLYSTATMPVPGEGNPQADLMCVGEAPGATEDQTGRPFVGAAGQLLTKILAAIDLPREQVFICNVLKHRPPGNRNPLPEEVTACSQYLLRQIELVKPKVIVAFGTFAAQTLLNSQLSLGKLRSQIHRYYGVPLIVTYHPAALLRNPSWKRPTWEDVQLARRILDGSRSGA
ncbi:MAG: uracil-DNA glycosylase [bacterium]